MGEQSDLGDENVRQFNLEYIGVKSESSDEQSNPEYPNTHDIFETDRVLFNVSYVTVNINVLYKYRHLT